MKLCKVIFLDFDGVLNCNASFERDRSPISIWEPCVAELDRVARRTGADVVISSAWRCFHPLDELTSLLWAYGFTGNVIGTTPAYFGSRPRGQEIQQWLNQKDRVPEKFVIIDDEDDMEHLTPHLVKTSMRSGLTPGAANKAIWMLK